jgi:hypothetical protein
MAQTKRKKLKLPKSRIYTDKEILASENPLGLVLVNFMGKMDRAKNKTQRLHVEREIAELGLFIDPKEYGVELRRMTFMEKLSALTSIDLELEGNGKTHKMWSDKELAATLTADELASLHKANPRYGGVKWGGIVVGLPGDRVSKLCETAYLKNLPTFQA